MKKIILASMGKCVNNNVIVFFELVRAGLWERDAQLLQYGNINYDEIYRLAEEQSVVGLVAAGIEHVVDIKPPQEMVLQIVGEALQLEQQNTQMNDFIGHLISRMRSVGVYALLVKGQGVAQCYERPLWRACGDVDLLLSGDNYLKAKEFLIPLASSVERESFYKKHLGMTIHNTFGTSEQGREDSWVVELHGKLWTGISKKIDKGIDGVQKDLFYGGNVRSWDNNGTTVFLPSPDNDVIIVFTHFLGHFFKGGVGLRQICDWCRLLWTYQKEINIHQLEKRLIQMGVLTEWRVFGVFAVDYLGVPPEIIPLFKTSYGYRFRARCVLKRVLRTGNMGHNIDQSYRRNNSFWREKTITFFRRFGEFFNMIIIFPMDAPRFFVYYTMQRMKAIFK